MAEEHPEPEGFHKTKILHMDGAGVAIRNRALPSFPQSALRPTPGPFPGRDPIGHWGSLSHCRVLQPLP